MRFFNVFSMARRHRHWKVGCVAVAVGIPLLAGGLSHAGAEPVAAVADVADAAGRPAGAAMFSQGAEGVTVVAEVRNLPPGRHGIHLHRVALCEPPDFKTAGAHFNPFEKKHGLKNPGGPHAGDLPNLQVGPDGTGHLTATIPGLSLVEYTQTAILNTIGVAMVIHAGPDDEMTDPAGNSGDRIACGVVRRSP